MAGRGARGAGGRAPGAQRRDGARAAGVRSPPAYAYPRGPGPAPSRPGAAPRPAPGCSWLPPGRGAAPRPSRPQPARREACECALGSAPRKPGLGPASPAPTCGPCVRSTPRGAGSARNRGPTRSVASNGRVRGRGRSAPPAPDPPARRESAFSGPAMVQRRAEGMESMGRGWQNAPSIHPSVSPSIAAAGVQPA